MKYRLLERIKDALKNTTEQVKKESNEKVKDLEMKLKDSIEKNEELQRTILELQENNVKESSDKVDNVDNIQNNDNVNVTELESQISKLTRELTEEKDKSVSLSQKIEDLEFKLQTKSEDKMENESQNNDWKQIQRNLENEIESLSLKLKDANENEHKASISIKEKDSFISELQQDLKSNCEDISKLQEKIKILQQQLETSKVIQNTPIISKDDRNNEDNAKVLELQLALQTHQNTISDLQQQCDSLREEILERKQIHEREITKSKEQYTSLENQYQESLQTQVESIKSYQKAYDEFENSIENIVNELENLSEIRDKFLHQQEELKSIKSQLSLSHKEIETKKEQLLEVKENLNDSKEIVCDLQKHILELSDNLTKVQQELMKTKSDYEKLQFEYSRREKMFEKEKTAIVFDMLQKNLKNKESTSTTLDEDDEFTESSYSTPKNGNSIDRNIRDEKKSLSLVKQNLINELWRESWDMINSPTSVSDDYESD